MNQEKIGKFIAECRKNKKLTQEQLAHKLGLTYKAVSKWECGKSLPDLSLFKPLCEELDITVNELLSGEKLPKDAYQDKFEENVSNTINYTNKKIESRNNYIGIIFIAFGILISITAVSIFPSESSWGSIYSVFGSIIFLIGISRFTKKLSYPKRLICNFSYFLLFILVLMTIDYIGVININQAPRFSLVKVTGDKVIYYDTPFYDVIRCNVNEKDETFKVIENQKYNRDKIDSFCK